MTHWAEYAGDDGYASLSPACDVCELMPALCDCDNQQPSRDTSRERIR